MKTSMSRGWASITGKSDGTLVNYLDICPDTADLTAVSRVWGARSSSWKERLGGTCLCTKVLVLKRHLGTSQGDSGREPRQNWRSIKEKENTRHGKCCGEGISEGTTAGDQCWYHQTLGSRSMTLFQATLVRLQLLSYVLRETNPRVGTQLCSSEKGKDQKQGEAHNYVSDFTSQCPLFPPRALCTCSFSHMAPPAYNPFPSFQVSWSYTSQPF